MLTYNLVVASTNAGKVKEIQSIFSALDCIKIKLDSISGLNIPEPDEPFDSFLANAIHKAKYYAQYTLQPTLSEDSGLSIEALDGFPGVKTKDFVLASGSIEQAFANFEAMLGAKKNNCKATFNCSAALFIPDTNELITHEEQVHGQLRFPAAGAHGFGFDPIFVPSGYNQTMAQLGDELKYKISHRGLAFKGLAHKLSTQLLSSYEI